MTYSNAWSVELARIVGLIVLALFLKFFLGSFWTSLALLLFGYLAWHLFNCWRLLRWFEHPKQIPPAPSGIWEPIFNLLYRNQKRAQKDKRRLKRQIDRFEESATALPDGTVILNKNNIIEWLNESAERVLGLRRGIDYGQRIDNFIRTPVFTQYLSSKDYENIIEMPSPVNRNIHLRIRLVPYGRKQKLLLARNVTRLHNLEMIRRDFIANVSHELRTPLTVVNDGVERF